MLYLYLNYSSQGLQCKVNVAVVIAITIVVIVVVAVAAAVGPTVGEPTVDHKAACSWLLPPLLPLLMPVGFVLSCVV